VAVNTNVGLELRDAGVGVDQSTITMRVNGSQVTPSISGTTATYTLSYNSPVDFNYDQTVSVVVDASDLNGNAMATDSYSFTTGPAPDTTPPYVTNRSPAPGATGAAVNTLVTLEVRDAGDGVNHSTITMRVNGSPVTPSISGNTAAYTLSYNTPVDFNYDQTVSIEVDASDLNGNAMATDSYSFTTGPAPDTTPPMISNIQATSITDDSAVITWTTDEPSDSEVQYGTTSGSYPSSRNSTGMVPSHSINLTGLSQNTTYYYRVRSKDAADNTRTSSELVFTTDPPPDYTVQGLPLVLQGSTPESNIVTLTFNNIPAGTASIELVLTVFDADGSTEGRLLINGQGPITLFGTQAADSNDNISVTLNPISTDPAWYQLGQNTLTFWHDSTFGFTIEDISISFSTNPPPDTTPPVISNVQVNSTTDTGAVITWTTDEPSDSEVQYDSASRLWGSYPWGENDASLVTSHSITLNGLEADTTYYFRVGSTDGSGNGLTTSNEMSFTTDAAPSPIPPNSPTRLNIIRAE
jgi:hypothetical protein